MRRGSIACLVLSCYAALLAFRAFAPPEVLVGWPYFDDSFYAFSVAINLAHGYGPTIDGVHLTNGFQPLWVFLITPTWWFSGEAYIPLRVLVLLSFLIHVLIWLLARRVVS